MNETRTEPQGRRPSDQDDHTSLSKETLKRAFLNHLFYEQGKFPALATRLDYYLALAYTVRDRLLQRWISTASAYTQNRSRTVAYLSAEFLMGPHLGNNLINLGIHDVAREAMTELGLDFDELLQTEEEPGLGNGGLGRLAACFIDSLATLEIPALGYGIRYEFGIFHQKIEDGWQVEKTDKWLRYGNPWELPRPEWTVDVKFGGHTEHYTTEQGARRVSWVPGKVVIGVPYDTPILGYRVSTANTLRLWKAEAPESFNFEVFNRGDYYGAVIQKVTSENLSKVLYPNDEQAQGKELRLEQQFFFVSCSLQDMLRIMKVQKVPLEQFHEKFTIQLNDTHPAIGVAELMRLLVDENQLSWEHAWDITCKSFSYTNHTLLPEALERWPLALFGRTLPRHLEIIYEINARFMEEVRVRFFGDERYLAALSLFDETGEGYVRMAHLACVGSHSINGVAELHSELLKQDVLKAFYEMWPEKFANMTNGVTPRRWMVLSNPRLSHKICEAIGDGWIRDLDQLHKLEPLSEDAAFRSDWRSIKRANKVALAARIKIKTGVIADPDSIFDVQVKRIHEYKRQHLAVLNIVWQYQQLKNNRNLEMVPRTYIFSGKAAPGYRMAKLIIKLITSVGDIVNRDPDIRDQIKVVFLPNFSVTNGQRIYPAADLSEQISTAGKEASGTGNMKFAMNGALTIGTMDGANIEIRHEVGAENFFLFGNTAEQIAELAKSYRPDDWYRSNETLRGVIDVLASGFFSRGDPDLFRPLLDSLLWHDPYFLFADFQAYADAQESVTHAYRDAEDWSRRAILNCARSGYFSSDRTIREYAKRIWRVESTKVPLLTRNEFEPDLG